MRLVRKLRRFLNMSHRHRLLLLEAALLLGCARLVLLTLPFGRMRAVGDAVTVAARTVPWNAVCLPQAMAAKAMLARRGQGSALHLGTKAEGGGLAAHAWLVAGGEIVVGEAGIAGMAPLARFG